MHLFMNLQKELIPIESIEKRILFIRGQKVILDADLAWLFDVPTRTLNQAVKRNTERFPADFIFQLTENEKIEVITVCDHLPKLKYAPNPPYAFTEHGVLMAASVLNSERAIHVSVYIIRVFVRLRQLLSKNRGLEEKLTKMELELGKHDIAIRSLATALKELTEPSLSKKRRPIGF